MDDLLAPLLDRFEHSSVDATSLIVLASALVPIVIAVAVWAWRDPNHAERGAVALAATWNAVWLLVANAVAVQLGWWTFADTGPALAGVPIVLWLGWTVLWGVAAPLSPWRPAVTLIALAGFDLVYMPMMHGVVDLGPRWLVGEVAVLAFVAWPGLLVADWSRTRTRTAYRVRLQVAMFTAMLLWVIPLLAVSSVGGTLSLDVPKWAFGAVLFGVGGASLPAITAVYDFYLNGGSPWPWDSTERAVRSGPYRFVRSPMQASGVLILVTMAFLFGTGAIALAAVVAVLYSRLFCEVETSELEARFGPSWSELALSQRRWIPSWAPHPASEPAVVWVNFDCDVCSPIADFLEQRHPRQLKVRPASEHPERLYRLRYERGDGATFDGVAGVGACLEHVNLAWAMVGWTLRLPVLWRLWQLVGDAVGFEPRPARPTTAIERPNKPLDLDVG